MSRREEAAVAAKKQQSRKQLRYYGALATVLIAVVLFFALRGGGSSKTAAKTTGATGASATITTTTAPAVASYGTLACPPTDGSGERKTNFDVAPTSGATGGTGSSAGTGSAASSGGFKQCIDPAKTYTATIKTSKGDLIVDLDAKAAPVTVNNFVSLARSKFFDSISCHRIMPAFVAQCGDPLGTGTGGPGYRFGDELPAKGAYQVGSLAMANSGPNTNGSQFFIITGDKGVALPPNYSLFAKAKVGSTTDATIAALDAAANPDSAANGVPPKEPVTITSVTITES